MRNNALTNLLVGVVAFSVLATAALVFYYVRSVQTLHRLQDRAAIINIERARANALANEVLEYSKHNPAMNAIIQSIGNKPPPAPASAGVAPKP